MAFKRRHEPQVVHADRPGQYGIAMPPDRKAEREYVERVVAQQKGLDSRGGHILDGELDAKLRQWNADIGQAFDERVGAFKDELAGVKTAAQRQGKKLAPLQERAAQAKLNLARAESDLLHGTAYQAVVPLAEAVTQNLSLRDLVPPPPINGVDPSRRYDGEGQLPSGFGPGDALHYGVLGLAGVADFVAFYQVLAVLLGSLPQLLYTLVVTISVITLVVMHKAGTTLREFRRRAPSGQPWIAALCLLIWALLGLTAYLLRLKVSDDTGGSASLFNFGGASIGEATTGGGNTIKALVFLAVFLTTGLVALIGAFRRHNPLRTAYRKARRSYEKAVKRLDKAEHALNTAHVRQALLEQRIEAEPAHRDRAMEQRHAFTCELKAFARTQVAKRLDHPADVEDLLSQPIPGCGQVSSQSGNQPEDQQGGRNVMA